MTGNRSKRNFIDAAILAYDFLNARSKVLYSEHVVAPAAPRGETRHGRTPPRAEIPLCGGARPRRLLVVPLRGLEEPAVLRRNPQDHRIHPGEIHHHQSRETLAVRLQAHAQSAVLRRHPQNPVAPPRAVRSGYFLAADQRPSCPLSPRNEPSMVAPVTRPEKSRRTPLRST